MKPKTYRLQYLEKCCGNCEFSRTRTKDSSLEFDTCSKVPFKLSISEAWYDRIDKNGICNEYEPSIHMVKK